MALEAAREALTTLRFTFVEWALAQHCVLSGLPLFAKAGEGYFM
jgi:hypothetical protein